MKRVLIIFFSVITITCLLILFDRFLGIIRKNTTENNISDRLVIYKTPEYEFKVQTNSQGFRGWDYPVEKSESTIRILAIGDSFTYGWGVELEDTWPYLLERKLNQKKPDKKFEVINLGIGGAIVQEYAALAEKYIPFYKPDYIMVGIVEGNDFAQITTSVDKDKKNITFETIGKRKQLLNELEKANYMLVKRILVNNLFFELLPNIYNLAVKNNPIHIRISFIENMRKHIYQLDNDDIDKLNKNMASEIRNIFMSGGLNPYLFLLSVRTPEYFINILDTDGKRYQEGIDKLTEIISEIKKIGLENNAETVVLDIPYGVFVNKSHIKSYQQMGFDGKADIWNSDVGEKVTINSSEKAGVEYITSLDIFREKCTDDCFYKYDDHMTAKGYGILSDIAMEWFAGF